MGCVANGTLLSVYAQEWPGGRAQVRSGRVRKISPAPGFDPRTVQPVASRYTDWAIPAHFWRQNVEKKLT